MRKGSIAVAALLALAASSASAQVFNLGNIVVNNPPFPGGNVQLPTAGLTGTFNRVRVTFDWGASVGDAWSSEALWALASESTLSSGTLYADPGDAPNSADDETDRSLSWDVLLNTPYTGGGDLYFYYAQDFAGSGATWSNVIVELVSFVPQPPTTVFDFGVISGSESYSQSLARGGVVWTSFETDGTTPVTIDTLGSILSPSSFGAPDDTELALFNSAGQLIATNDDIDFDNDNFLSSLSFAAGELAGGTYYVAATGFDGVFGGAFSATSSSISTGTININITIPTPGALASLGVAGLLAARRRR